MAYNKKQTLIANTKAIQTLFRLEEEHRSPTETEREILSQYNGFGGLKCVLNPTDTLADRNRWKESELELFPLVVNLKSIIREASSSDTQAKMLWNSIKQSVLTSFYTDQRITDAVARATYTADIRLNTLLDPSAGMGVFSQSFAQQQTKVTAFEKDKLT